jgi:hypothetical protein
MDSINLREVQLIMSLITFLLGFTTFGVGLYILISGSLGRDMRVIATQTTKLAQKGLAEEISGLVGNASSLLNALNGMVHTRAGIGVFLTIIGLFLMGSSFWLVFRIN